MVKVAEGAKQVSPYGSAIQGTGGDKGRTTEQRKSGEMMKMIKRIEMNELVKQV